MEAQWVEAVGTLVAAALAAAAFVVSVTTWRKSSRIQHYGEIDRMYFDLLAIAVERPWLRAPRAITSDSDRLAYDAYAFMVWNFVETISDRCENDPDLEKTWKPAMEAENRLHRAWFDDPRNHHKFKEEFRDYVRRALPAPPPPDEPAGRQPPAPA